MNAFLSIITGLIVLTGSGFIGLAPIWKSHEKSLRVIGVCCTVAGGLFGLVFGLRSASKTDTLMKNTSQILQQSETAVSGINQTLSTSKDILDRTKENLDRTNQNLGMAEQNLDLASKTAHSSQETLSYVSGGDSRPEIFPVAITREDGTRGIGFFLIKRGKFPLYGLTLSLGKPHRDPANGRTLLWENCRLVVAPSSELQELQVESSRLVCFEPLPKEDSTYFEADMHSRNGHWDEIIRVLKTPSGDCAIRWALFESRNLPISPNKQVFDLADEKFPTSERRKKIHPLIEVLPE